jgi:integrase
MAKPNVKNELTKRRFFRWLKEADQCCDATVNNVEKAILLYEEFTRNSDFLNFGPDRAVDFKQWLLKRETRGGTIAVATFHNYLRFLRKFFSWLAEQPGYRRRVTHASVDYLRVTEKEESLARQTTRRDFPPLEYVQKLVGSIAPATEVDRRDRALIAFTLLSGMRDSAIVSLPIGCFDQETLLIDQSPRQGVKTKFSKHILTTLLPIDARMRDYVQEWTTHLKSRGFCSGDPLFPRSKADQGEDRLSFSTATEVEPVAWRNAGRMRDIFRARDAAAGLPYFPPHTFRHLAFTLAWKSARTGEEMKAVSQNFGHEFVATMFASYGNYAPDQLSQVIQGLDRSGSDDPELEEMMTSIRQTLMSKRRNGVL